MRLSGDNQYKRIWMQILIKNSLNKIFQFKIPELLEALIKPMNYNQNIINKVHSNNIIINSTHNNNTNNLTIRYQILASRNKQMSQLVLIKRLKKGFLILLNFLKIRILIITIMIKNNSNWINKLSLINHQK